MRLRQLFMHLARVTSPMGYESFCWGYIPNIHYIDTWNNVWCLVKNPDGSYPTTMFSSHCDNACQRVERVVFNLDGDIIKTNGKTILGADDKIGVALMIKLLYNKTPGWYMFHAGEERGGVGSRALALRESILRKDKKTLFPGGNILRCVAFDRRGKDSVITHQGGSRTCSDAFAVALCEALGMSHCPDRTGSFTDSKSYYELIPECTNISVGYQGEHTHDEKIDVGYCEDLLERLYNVKWEELPTERDLNSKDYGWAYSSGSYSRDKDNKLVFQPPTVTTYRSSGGTSAAWTDTGHRETKKARKLRQQEERKKSVIGFTPGAQKTTSTRDVVTVEGSTYEVLRDENKNLITVRPCTGTASVPVGPIRITPPGVHTQNNDKCNCGVVSADGTRCYCGRLNFLHGKEAAEERLIFPVTPGVQIPAPFSDSTVDEDPDLMTEEQWLKRGNRRNHSIVETPRGHTESGGISDCPQCGCGLIQCDYVKGYCTHCHHPLPDSLLQR